MSAPAIAGVSGPATSPTVPHTIDTIALAPSRGSAYRHLEHLNRVPEKSAHGQGARGPAAPQQGLHLTYGLLWLLHSGLHLWHVHHRARGGHGLPRRLRRLPLLLGLRRLGGEARGAGRGQRQVGRLESHRQEGDERRVRAFRGQEREARRCPGDLPLALRDLLEAHDDRVRAEAGDLEAAWLAGDGDDVRVPPGDEGQEAVLRAQAALEDVGVGEAADGERAVRGHLDRPRLGRESRNVAALGRDADERERRVLRAAGADRRAAVGHVRRRLRRGRRLAPPRLRRRPREALHGQLQRHRRHRRHRRSLGGRAPRRAAE
mmetsp:Transcript_53250/g.140425  ORF Transcript_53250/g.140425 Transcript_53250/m.140425 type:complete len:319 (+) Transcript_53250:602-1558(+)